MRDPLAPVARAASGGDRRAERELLSAVGPKMIATLRTMVPRSELEDVTQEAMLRFLSALRGFRFECSVGHFACRVAVYTATVANRTRSRRARADDLGRVAALEPLQADELLAARRRESVLSLLAALPEEQALSFALRVVLGCSLAEVAEITDAPLNTVRSRLRLAKEAMRRLIDEDPALVDLLEEPA